MIRHFPRDPYGPWCDTGYQPPGAPTSHSLPPSWGNRYGGIFGRGGLEAKHIGPHHAQWFPLGVTQLTKTRQVTQVSSAALHIPLALFSGTVCSFLSMQPNHIFLHQIYRNTMGTVSSLDQFTHIFPPSIWYIAMPRYYFLGTTFTTISLHKGTTFLGIFFQTKQKKEK